jgi:hypothetical protein
MLKPSKDDEVRAGLTLPDRTTKISKTTPCKVAGDCRQMLADSTKPFDRNDGAI